MTKINIISTDYLQELKKKNQDNDFLNNATVYKVSVVPNNFGSDEIKYTNLNNEQGNEQRGRVILIFDASMKDRLKNVIDKKSSPLKKLITTFTDGGKSVLNATGKVLTSPIVNAASAAVSTIANMAPEFHDLNSNSFNSNGTQINNSPNKITNGSVTAGYALAVGLTGAIVSNVIGTSILNAIKDGGLNFEVTPEEMKNLLSEFNTNFKLNAESQLCFSSLAKEGEVTRSDSRAAMFEMSMIDEVNQGERRDPKVKKPEEKNVVNF
jgi:hypothetical protein